MVTSSSSTKSVIRGILRRLKVQTERFDNTVKNTMRTFVLGEYRVAGATSETAVTARASHLKHHQERHQLAKDYLQLLEDMKERNRLQVLDTGAEVQLSGHEMSRRAAARAGLQLPKLDPSLQKDFPTPSPPTPMPSRKK